MASVAKQPTERNYVIYVRTPTNKNRYREVSAFRRSKAALVFITEKLSKREDLRDVYILQTGKSRPVAFNIWRNKIL